MTRRHAKLLLIAALVTLVPFVTNAGESLEPFYGRFEGKALEAEGAELGRRDVAVQIEPNAKKGFKLTWTTVIKRADGRVKRKTHTVSFVPSSTDDVYASAMRTNVFGKSIPLDPLKGDPYVWATISGKTMIVHALVITEDHGYEMQTYERTITDAGMDLDFNRVRDGERLRDIRAKLVRLAD